MLAFAAPAFLVAGALLALAPLALHMLARTPPERRPLPTARFLSPDRRTRLRLRPPTDRGLLALRMAFIVLLCAAFAGPVWAPDRDGGRVVVLLDAGAGMAPVWGAALGAARERVGAGGTLVVFDTTARIADDALATLDSLSAAGPGAAAGDYLAALRGLRAAGAALPAESASAVLVTRPRWGAWSPGVTTAREAAWAGRIEVVALEVGEPAPEGAGSRAVGPDAASPSFPGPRSSTAARPVRIDAPGDHPLRPYLHAALEALGHDVTGDQRGSGDGDAPGNGITVVADTRTAEPAAARAGTAQRSPALARGRLVLPGGRALDGWRPAEDGLAVRARTASSGGAPAPGGASPPGGAGGPVLLPVWEDGRPAATVTVAGDHCVARLDAAPVRPGAAGDPSFPRLLQALIAACARGPGGVSAEGPGTGPLAPGGAAAADAALAGVPLDAGALALLRAESLAEWVALERPEGAGRSLARWALALALLLAVAEGLTSYGRRGAA